MKKSALLFLLLSSSMLHTACEKVNTRPSNTINAPSEKGVFTWFTETDSTKLRADSAIMTKNGTLLTAYKEGNIIFRLHTSSIQQNAYSIMGSTTPNYIQCASSGNTYSAYLGNITIHTNNDTTLAGNFDALLFDGVAENYYRGVFTKVPIK